MNKLGYIVSLEGIDFSGKSTQRILLEQYFKSRKIDYVSSYALDGTELCEKIRPILLDLPNVEPLSELLLFAAARHQIVKEIIEPAIMSNKMVLLDRYIDSSLVYQGYFQGVSLDLIETINKSVVHGFEPDLTLLIDIKKDTFLDRIFKAQELDFIEKKAIDCYEKLSYGYHQILKSNKRVKLIDGEKNIKDVHLQIVDEIDKLID